MEKNDGGRPAIYKDQRGIARYIAFERGLSGGFIMFERDPSIEGDGVTHARLRGANSEQGAWAIATEDGMQFPEPLAQREKTDGEG